MLRQLLVRVLTDEGDTVLALTDAGFTVHAAQHGTHALQLLETLAPCLIVLDLRMPVMDGAAFVRAYRKRPDAHAHLVVMTAEGQKAEIWEIGPSAGVRTPFDLDQLLSVVERWVTAHRPPTGDMVTEA